MQKEIVARATIKTPNTFFNDGFIHIKDNFLEGIFTLDYLKMCIYENKAIAHLSERNIFLDNHRFLCERDVETLFKSKSNCTNLYNSNKFFLYDEAEEELVLSILEPVEPYEIPLILERLNKVRF